MQNYHAIWSYYMNNEWLKAECMFSFDMTSSMYTENYYSVNKEANSFNVIYILLLVAWLDS